MFGLEDKLHDRIAELEAEVAKRDERIKELEWFSNRITSFVMPGEVDTQDAALLAFKKLTTTLAMRDEKIIELTEKAKYSESKWAESWWTGKLVQQVDEARYLAREYLKQLEKQDEKIRELQDKMHRLVSSFGSVKEET